MQQILTDLSAPVPSSALPVACDTCGHLAYSVARLPRMVGLHCTPCRSALARVQ